MNNSPDEFKQLQSHLSKFKTFQKQWDSFSNESFTLASNYLNTVGSIRKSRDIIVHQRSCDYVLDWAVDEDKEALENEEELYEKWEASIKHIRELQILLSKMRTACEQLVALVLQVNLDFTDSGGNSTVSSSMADQIAHFAEMYQAELGVKEIIVQDLPNCRDRDSSMLYLSTWIHSPYLDQDQITEFVQLWERQINSGSTITNKRSSVR